MWYRLSPHGLAAALLVALTATAVASPAPRSGLWQGSAEDYARSAGLGERFKGLVDRAGVRPEWLDQTRLWYQVATGPATSELVLVDASAAAGRRRRVLASTESLAEAFGRPRAQVARLAFAGAGPDRLLVLLEGGDLFEWDLAQDQATPASVENVGAFRIELAGSERVPSRSRRGGRPSAAAVVNESNIELTLEWITPEGGRREYGRIAPGESRWQTSFEGHAFALADERGVDRAWFRVEARPGVALITAADAANVAEPVGSTRPKRPTGVSPNGQFRVVHRDGDLWLRDLETQSEARVTADGGGDIVYREPALWAPDGSHFVCLRIEREPTRMVQYVDSAPDDQLQPRVESVRYRKPGDAIDGQEPRLFRMAGDAADSVTPIPIKRSDLFETPWSISRLEWEPDGGRFTFLYNERGHRVMRWVAVDAESGRATALIEEAPETFFDYASKTFLHRFAGTDDVLWMSERSGWNHLYLVNARTREVNRVTSGDWVVRSVEDVDDDERTVLLRVMGIHREQDPYHLHFARVDVDSGELTLLTQSDGTHEVDFCPDGSLYVATWSRVDQAPTSELRRTSDGALVCELERADDTRLREAGWRAPERFVAKGRDGTTDIWGVVHRPTNYDPTRRYPVVESIYAGPHDAHVPKSWRGHRKQAELAELGFVVVQIDGMGTNWRSKTFHDVAWKNLGDAGFADRIAWLRALAATDPSLDLDRLGIYGGSAGGQNAMRALIAHGDVYRAAVADCGCHDNRMDKIWWNELWMSWPVGPHYAESSNVDHAHRLRGDLLLVVGEVDSNVDPASTMQVVDALIRANKDFELLVMPGVGHGAAETPYGTRRRRDFLVRKLMRVEPRWK